MKAGEMRRSLKSQCRTWNITCYLVIYLSVDILEIHVSRGHLIAKCVQRLFGTWLKFPRGKENKRTTGCSMSAPFLLPQCLTCLKQHYFGCKPCPAPGLASFCCEPLWSLSSGIFLDRVEGMIIWGPSPTMSCCDSSEFLFCYLVPYHSH